MFGGCRPDRHSLLFWLLLQAATPPTVLNYFLGDTKAVLKGCEDHWTLQDRTSLPQLNQMTVCVDIRVVVPGAWVAFSYSSIYAPKPELGLEGDEKAVYAWLLRVRHRFPIKLKPTQWHRLCLRRDAHKNSFSLELEGRTVAERSVYSQAIPASGSLWLGCRPRDQPPGRVMAEVELYLFRMWAGTGNYAPCEDGTVIGWDSEYWGVTSPKASQTDEELPCDPRPSRLCKDELRTKPVGLRPRPDWRLSDDSSHRGWSPQPRRRFRGGSNWRGWPDRRSNNVLPNRPGPHWRSPNTGLRPGTGWRSSNTGLRPGTGWRSSNTGPKSARGGSVTNIFISANAVSSVGAVPLPAPRIAKDAKQQKETNKEGSSSATCKVSPLQYCSSNDTYFWMVLNVQTQKNNIENEAKKLVSDTFSCTHNKTAVFCQGGKKIKVKPVSCGQHQSSGNANCSMILSFSHAVSPCDLLGGRDSKLLQDANSSTKATIVGVERVGKCEDKNPADKFCHRLTTTLEQTCPSSAQDTFNCTIIDLESMTQVPRLPDSCSGGSSCTCSAFCNSTSQFFATKINVNNNSVNVNIIKALLVQCQSELCREYEAQFKEVEVKCDNETKQSCLVVLEMSAAVNVCSLSQIMQQIFNTSGISVKESLRRMVLCGSAGSTREALLRSNWTWDSTQRQFSEVCTQDHDIKCATTESLAVFLYDNCSQATSPATTLTPRSDSTNYFVQTTFETTNGGSMTSSPRQMEVTTALAATQPPVLPTTKPDAAVTPSHSTVGMTKSNTETILSHPGYPSSEMAGWSTPLYTDDSMFTQMTLEPITDAQISVLTTQNQPTTEQTNSTTTVESQQNNTTTTQPPAEAPEDQNTTTQNQPMTDTTNGTTAVPSQPRNTTETPDSTTANNTTSPNLLTQLTNATTTTQSGATDVQQDNSTTWSPSDTTVNNQTTVRPVSSSPNDTTRHETTTQTTHNTSDSTRTVSHETAFNTTTNEMTNTLQPGVTSAREQHNSTVTTTNTAVSQSSTNNVTDNVTTAPANNPTVNSTSVTNYSDNTTGNTAATGNTMTTASLTNNHTTAIPSHITRYNESTVTNEFTGDNNTFTPTTNNYTEEYSQTTGVNNYTTTFNTTSTASNYTTVLNNRNTTTAYTTTSPNYTTNNTSRTANGYVTTDNNNTALHNYTTENNTTAVPKSYTTTTNNLTTTINNHTTMSNNLTTTINNHTTTSNNLTTMINNHTTTSNNLTTMINNHTTTSNNYTTNYNLTTASTINATTTPHNYTAFVNYTTTSNNYTTASTNHTTVFNLTTPSSANVTTSSNYTTTNPLTSISSNHTTVTMSNVTVVPPSTLLYNQTANNTTTSVTTPSATTDSGGNATTAAAHASKTTTSNVANMTTTGGALLPPTDTTTVEDATTTTTTTTNNPTTAAADPTSTSVAQTTNSEQSLEALADDLLEQTKDVSKLDAAQVARLVKQLEKLLEGPSVSESLGQKVVQVVSNLVEADPAALSGSANRLIQIVDTVGIKLSLSGDRGVLSAESLVLAVRAVDGTNFPTTSVNIFGTNSVQLRALGRSRSKRSDSALGSVVLPPGLTDGLSPQQQQQANRVQFTYFSSTAFFQDETLDNTTMVSPVLGSSVANLSISNLTENVLFMIQNLQPVPENFTASCVFWDFSVNGDRGGWSSEGCSVVNSTAEATTCSCNHLTSFAILLDFPREEMIDPRHAQILTFITYIGCGVSAIFLAFTLLTYLLFDKLMRDIPAKILVQLCFSLLFLNLVFLLDGWLALYPAVGLCISTAFFLHYFLLTSFTWTGLEAVHMYLSIVQVFTPYLSRYMLKFSLVGWGFPLIVVIVIIAVNKDNYGLVTYGKYTDGTTDDFCWLRNDIAFYVGVVAYFLLIFSVCVVVFIIVMVQLARIKRQNPHNQAANRGVLADARSITGLVVLLGLTWGFALFAWGPLYIPFVYLFTICNSFQGFLIFVFHCAVKENVRRQWRTHLCCGRLRLAENSDWSRTATQSNRHPSMNTTNTSAPFSTSRSSSVSDSTTSGFALVDSGIYDNTTTDVVLNEAHRRALNLEREN